MLDTRIGNWLTDVISRTATMWLGICFLFVWCLVVLQVIGWVLKVSPQRMGIAAIAIVVAATIYSIANAMTIYIRKIELNAPVNMRIVQISDLHIGSTGGRFISRVMDNVNELKPDIVLITGDLVDTNKSSAHWALQNLNQTYGSGVILCRVIMKDMWVMKMFGRCSNRQG